MDQLNVSGFSKRCVGMPFMPGFIHTGGSGLILGGDGITLNIQGVWDNISDIQLQFSFTLVSGRVVRDNIRLRYPSSFQLSSLLFATDQSTLNIFTASSSLHPEISGSYLSLSVTFFPSHPLQMFFTPLNPPFENFFLPTLVHTFFHSSFFFAQNHTVFKCSLLNLPRKHYYIALFRMLNTNNAS